MIEPTVNLASECMVIAESSVKQCISVLSVYLREVEQDDPDVLLYRDQLYSMKRLFNERKSG